MKFFLPHSVLLLLFLSCEKTVAPHTDTFVEFDFKNLRIEMAYYDTVEVRATPTTKINTRIFDRILIGTKRGESFVPLRELMGVFDNRTRSYAFELSSRFPVEYARLSFPVTLRFHRLDGTIKDIDTLISTLQYPYKSTEPVLLLGAGPSSFEDIEVSGGRIYLQPNGTLQWVYIYNFFQGAPGDSLPIEAYEVITLDDSSNVYFDDRNCSIVTYNLISRTYQTLVPRSAVCYTGIITLGLEFNEGYLYELFYEPTVRSLKKWDTNGRLVDSVEIKRNVYRLSIHNGIAYFQLSSVPLISRFDLTTKTFLSDIPNPTKDGEGIRIRDGYLYFLDYARKIAGRVRFDEVLASTR